MTKAKAITNDITQNINTQRIILRAFIMVFVFLFIVYIYLVGSITFNIVARKSLENTVVNLTGNINQLEIKYLNNVNNLNKDYAKSKGFIDVRQNIFATRDVNYVAIR